MRVLLVSFALGAVAAAAVAQQPQKPRRAAKKRLGCAGNTWLADQRRNFHAQVLLDIAGFSPGVIDGKKGIVADAGDQGLPGSEWAASLRASSTTPTRQALLQQNRASTVNVEAQPTTMSGPFRLPVPEEAGGSGEAEVPRLPQHARESRRALSHHADTSSR